MNYMLYFSPTGGTEKVTRLVAEGFGGEFIPVDLLSAGERRHFTSADLCFFAVPSFGGRVPDAAMKRLELLSGNGAKAVLIAVFGNRAIDDTLLELSDGVSRAGFVPVAGVEAVAQHSLLPKYGAGRPDDQDAGELREFGRRIREGMENLPRELKLPGNRPYHAYSGVPLKPRADSSCIGCGICREECPVGAIPMNCHLTDSRKCISCMHCVAVCPKHARKVNSLLVFAATQAMKKGCIQRKPNQLYL